MKIKNQSQSSRKIFTLFLVMGLLIIIGIYGAYILWQRSADQTTTTNLDEGQRKDIVTTNPEDKQSPPNTDTPETPQFNEQSNKTTVTMTVAVTVANDVLYIRGGINNTVRDNGMCYATLTNTSGESLRKDTTLLQNATTTDCKTIVMKTSELTRGDWSVKLYFSSDDMEGVSNEASFTVL